MRAASLRRQRENRQRRKLRGLTPRICSARLAGCQGTGTDLHEVKTRARGGSITDPMNVVPLCRSCHMEITRNSGKEGWAIRHGWVVASWSSPEDERIATNLRLLVRCQLDCPEDHRG